MLYKKKFNTITIFFIFFSLFVAVATATLIITTYQEVKHKTVLELKYINKMASKSFNFEIQQYEILLRLLGERLLEINALNNPKQAKTLVQGILNADKNLAGIGLIRTDGQLILISNVPLDKKLPNLLKNESSRNSFKNIMTNSSRDIDLGRTYYMTALKKWVIPMRLSIYDKKGNKAFIIAAGIDLESPHPWKSIDLNENTEIFLLRKDKYFQYISYIPKDKFSLFYDNPVPVSTLNQINEDSIYKLGMTVLNITDRDNTDLLITTEYQDRYKYTSVAVTPNEIVYKNTLYNLVYFLSGIVLFYIFALFFYIISNSKDRKQTAELIWNANHDLLTKLPNRYFLEHKVKIWNHEFSKFSILFLDLDNFKLINDNYGHPFGDKLILAIALRLSKLIDSHEHVIRQGGDEFIIISSKVDDELDQFAKHILHTISETVELNNVQLHPKISIGISNYPQDGSTLDTLLSKADMALYKAKENKGSYCKYSGELETISKLHLDIEQELRMAHKNNEYYVLLQPQMDAKTLKIKGVEALVRWENKKLGFIPPDKFIPIAEEIGEIHSIGQFVLKEACIICLNAFKETSTYFNLSVNASVQELLYDNYVNNILKTLEEVNFPKDRLIIEVTESLLVQDVQKAKQVLSTLRSEGIGVSLDDFGTGYSSLSMLNGLPVTELKIDQSFVRDILIDNQDLALTKSIITLAKLFHLKTVAEGVEEEGQVKELQNAGCNILQGYYFSKPISQEDLIIFINNDN